MFASSIRRIRNKVREPRSIDSEVRATADELSMDVVWLHATLEWLILGESDPDVSRPTMARKAHDKIDRLAKAAGSVSPSTISTVPLVDQGAASAIQTGGLLSSATSSVQPFSPWSSPHPHRPQR